MVFIRIIKINSPINKYIDKKAYKETILVGFYYSIQSISFYH